MAGMVSLLFLGLAIVFIITGIGILLVGRLRKTPSAKADGVIIGFESGEVSDFDGTKEVFYPIVTFSDVSGEEHEVISPVGKGAFTYREGQHIDVKYWPTNPEVGFVVGSEHEMLAIIVGGILIVFGLFFLFLFFGS